MRCAIPKMLTKTIVLLCLVIAVANGQLYDALYKKLSKRGMKNTIPVSELKKPIKLSLTLSAILVNSLDPDTGDLDLDAWLHMTWKDERLTWNPDDFNSVTKINMFHSDIWRPDITTYGGRAQQNPELGVVTSNGTVWYVPVTRIRYRCDVTHYTANGTVTCNIKMGSWTYSGYAIDLQPGPMGVVDASEYRGGRWEIVSHSGVRNEAKYECCPEPYPNVVATIVFKDTKSKEGYFNIF